MKSMAAIGSLLALTTLSGLAQGTIQFANIFGTATARTFLAPIYGPDPNPTGPLDNEIRHGNTADGVPVGTQVYPGGVLNSVGYTLGLFKGETMIASATIRTSPTGALPAGTIAVITATVPEALPGTTVQLTVRAWETVAGSYAGAVNSVVRLWGSSEVFTTGRLGGIDPTDGSIITAPNTVGWTSFNVHGVPEPSTVTLGILGLGSLLLFRRR